MIKRIFMSVVLVLASVASLGGMASETGATVLVTGANRGIGL